MAKVKKHEVRRRRKSCWWVTHSGMVITEEIAEEMAEEFEKNPPDPSTWSAATSAVPRSARTVSRRASASAFRPTSTKRPGRGPTRKAARSATSLARRSPATWIPNAAVPLSAWSATRPWRLCSCRCGRRAPSRRRSSGSGARSGSACWRRAAKLPPERELARRAADLALDPAPGADGAGAERAPGLAAGAEGRHLRLRAAAADRARPASRSTRAPGRCSTTGSRSSPARCCWRPSGASEAQFDRLEELVAKMAGELEDFEEYRRTDIRFHIGIAEAAQLAAAAQRDDRRAVADERPDRADRPPARGPRPLQRAARAAWSRRCARATAPRAVRQMREHIEGTEHILAGLLPAPLRLEPPALD